jgi:hypothetical protein
MQHGQLLYRDNRQGGGIPALAGRGAEASFILVRGDGSRTEGCSPVLFARSRFLAVCCPCLEGWGVRSIYAQLAAREPKCTC